MKTFLIIWAILVGLLPMQGASAAGPPAKTARIGFLGAGSSSDPARLREFEAFREGLRDLGYVEGQNYLIEARWSEGNFERLAAHAAELVRLNVHVIVTSGIPGAQAAKRATQTIPIVVSAAADLVGAGLAASLPRPGGNLTGTSDLTAELSGKRLELLKELVPRLSRVAVLWNPANAGRWRHGETRKLRRPPWGFTSCPSRCAAPTRSKALFRGRPEAGRWGFW